MNLSTWLTSVRSALAQFASTEARLAATAALLAVAVLASLLVAPRVVSRVARELRERVISHPNVPAVIDEVTWMFPPTAVIRLLQGGVLAATSLALLVVWGFEEVAFGGAVILATLAPYLARAAVTLVLLAAAVVVIDLLESWLEDYASDSEQINEHQEGIVFRVLQLVVLLTVGLSTMAVWGVEIGGLLVGAGFLGIVVGMAARQTLGSLIAGFVLMFSRPFEIGDWVEIDGEEGIVSDITIVNTRLRNFDGEEIVFPNDRVTNATVTNRTRRGQLRLTVDVGVDYGTDLERAEEIAEAAIEGADMVAEVPSPKVLPATFDDSAVGLKVRFWIQNPSAPRRARARAAVVRAVKTAFDSEGIKIPYPQRELQGRAETGGFRVRRSEGAFEERPDRDGERVSKTIDD
ncbi:mechanosensitive ion channel family protein [Halopelagius longus]|uniref:Mechanosensitive ion channel family protein n=1 Tax=Halopelagius longus TaxID=1236180 RepID=A0A1H0ZBH9_9EURY|nr:mechanosensitive ion channel family protein [Halopelagius longus]RDI72928.1 mechanosensitive ion channel family protein [Halopelagius longus]SDQ24835.1 Small-conductance mechanosensitive channel [Halopelagius longus]